MTDNEKYLKNELESLKNNIKDIDDDCLLTVLYEQTKEYYDYCSRSDCVPWTKLSEEIVTEMYFLVRNECLRRMGENKEE